MAADNIISLGFNYDELTTEQKAVVALLDQVLDKAKQLNGIQMNPSTDGLGQFRDNLRTSNEATTALTSVLPQLTAAQIANNAAQLEAAKLAKAKADAISAEERATQARSRTTAQNTAAMRADARAAADASNDYKQLSLAYNDAALRAKNYALQLGDSHPLTVQAIADANVYGDRLRALDASVGQFQRNVGNYSSALTGYANTLRGLRGPTKLLGEALGIGAVQADQLRLILEHSLQGLAAFFRGKESAAAATAEDTVAQAANTTANAENTTSTTINSASQRANAAATGQAAVAQEGLAVATVESSAAMRLFGTALKFTGIGLAVAAIAFLIYKIIEYRKEMNEAIKYGKLLSDLNEETAKNAGAESAQLQITKADLESENVSRKTKLQLIKDLKEEYPDIFTQYSTEQILLGQVANAYDLAAAAIIRKAKAEAASKQIGEIATKQLDIELKRQQDLAETTDKITNAKSDASVSSGGTGGTGGNFGGASRDEKQRTLQNDFKDREAARTKEYDSLEQENQFFIKFAVDGANETTKIDKAAKEKKVKTAKDTSFEILENARKESFDLRQLQEKDVADNLKRQSENKDNGTDQRIDALLEMSLKEQEIILAQSDFEKNAVKRRLDYELTTEKHNQDEIIALKAKAVGDIALLDQKQSDESIKQGRAAVDAIKKLEDEAAKATEKSYDETQKAAMAELERKARIMEKDEKDKEKKPKKEKEDTSVQDGEIDVARQTQETIFSFVEDRFEREKNLIQRRIDLIQKASETEIASINASSLSNQEKAAQILIAEKTAASQTQALKRQQRDDEIKQARFAKAQAAAEIVENTAIAVMAALKLPFIGEARAIEIGAVGALQLATVLAKPIPAYAKGIEATPRSEWAITGEGKHPEIVQEPNKSPYVVSTATLSYLPKNTRVTPILDNAVQSLGNAAMSNQFMSMARLNGMMDIKVQMGEQRMVNGIVGGIMHGIDNLDRTFKKRQPPIVNNIKDMSAFYAYKDSQTKR